MSTESFGITSLRKALETTKADLRRSRVLATHHKVCFTEFEADVARLEREALELVDAITKLGEAAS